MTKAIRWACFFVLSLCAIATTLAATPQKTQKPLESTRLIALIAGDALPESVIALVKAHGLAFKPSELYLKQLAEAGANVQELDVVSKAVVHADMEAEDFKQESQILAHLATAGKLLREWKSKEAAKEINAAMQIRGGLDAGFVMGDALAQQEE